MKQGIHPNYEKCIIRCACGEVVETMSTKGGEQRVDICSKCHPFFTGKQTAALISSRREWQTSRSNLGTIQGKRAQDLPRLLFPFSNLFFERT